MDGTNYNLCFDYICRNLVTISLVPLRRRFSGTMLRGSITGYPIFSVSCLLRFPAVELVAFRNIRIRNHGCHGEGTKVLTFELTTLAPFTTTTGVVAEDSSIFAFNSPHSVTRTSKPESSVSTIFARAKCVPARFLNLVLRIVDGSEDAYNIHRGVDSKIGIGHNLVVVLL